jgi:DNA-binding LacI/PurR family transcriptional regulator
MPTKKSVTSRQVAKQAGVSQTTVSFVLNNVEWAKVSEETRQRVLKAARELGYVPDAAARSLAAGHSSNIGLILLQSHKQMILHQFVSNVIMGINQVIQPKGFRLLLEVVSDDSPPDILTDLARGKEVAGMIVDIIYPTPQIAKLKALAAEGLPIVLLSQPIDGFYAVVGDHLTGVEQAVSHLATLGHRRIACITYGPLTYEFCAAHRLKAYRETLGKLGLVYDENLIRVVGNYDPQSGYQAMLSLLDVEPRPTALFAMNDVMAFGAMAAIQESGLCVPQDIAVVGFDDIPLARYTTPALTTIHAPDTEQGIVASEMIMNLIEGRKPSEFHTLLKTELTIRNSCGARR